MTTLTAPRHWLLTAICTLLLTTRVFAASGDNELLNFKENAKLPSFTLQELTSGKDVAFETNSGKPSVLMFFSVTPLFREQRSLGLAGAMTKLAGEFQGRVNFAAVFADAQGGESVKRFIQDRLITIPVLDDGKRQVHDRYGIFMMPLAILIAADGTLQTVAPYTFNIDEILANNLKFLLGEWSKEQWQGSFKPQENSVKSKEELEYVRRVNYGRVMLSRKMLSAALREFMTAAKILPKAIEAPIGVGQVQLADNKPDLAEEAFRKALELDQESDDALAGLGLCLYQKGAMKEAIPILENALISAEPQLEVIVALADYYEQNGLLDKAMRLNKLAIAKLLKRFN
jgi:tetratricopeptide (TPR) repeat protein